MDTPKAFISHASADKDRIVRLLEEGLRRRGVQTWLDERDVLPGDKLVDKIFREGISESDIFVVVLTKNSIDRPWVVEELDAAVVHRIAGRVRAIIPIVLDNVELPPSLVATVKVTIDDPNDSDNLERLLDRIAQKVFGKTAAFVAPAPAWTRRQPIGALGLNAIDEAIFEFTVRRWIETNYFMVNASDIAKFCEQQNISLEELEVSFDALRELGEAYAEGGTRLPIAFSPHSWAAARYLEAVDAKQYAQNRNAIIATILNDKCGFAADVVAKTNLPEAVVEIVLDQLKSDGAVEIAKHSEGIYIMPRPVLSRMLS